MITYKTGNLLDSDCQVICHQTNCKGKMGAGIAKQIRDRYPRVYDAFLRFHKEGKDRLGEIGIVYTEEDPLLPWRYVINMYAQDKYFPRSIRHTDYVAFAGCISSVKNGVAEYNEKMVKSGQRKFVIKKIGFPDHIGCGLAGGDWETIRGIIEDAFGKSKQKVEIWKLE